MTTQQFNAVINDQIASCLDVLYKKSDEYRSDDILHNFKTAAILKQESPIKTLAGMMAKHTVSIYDLCMADQINRDMGTWQEKIIDSINYLLFLSAILEEEGVK